MKKIILTCVITSLFINQSSSQTMGGLKKFDYSILENKVLLIPKYSAKSTYAERLSKKGKYEKLKTLNEKVKYYNSIWTEAMAQSSWDVCPYEIKAFDKRKLFKEKNNKAIILQFVAITSQGSGAGMPGGGISVSRSFTNYFAQLWVTGPKKMMIASALINGIDIEDVSGLRLVMNLLNHSLNETAEVSDEGSKVNRKALKNKYKQNFLEYYERIPDMVFLVPKVVNEKKPSKASKKNAELKAALKVWKLSKYELTTQEEIEKRRLNGDPDSYYWLRVPYYSNITYNFNYLLTTEKDEVISVFIGKGKLKGKTIINLQEKIKKKAEKYKKQMEK